MNKEIFIRRLRDALSPLSDEEIENAVQYYEEYFADAGEENQADVIEALGSPEAIAENIIREAGQPVPAGSPSSAGFNAVKIETIAAAIELIPSDHFSYEVMESSNCYMEYSIKNGVLTIKERRTKNIFSIFAGAVSGFVKVYFDPAVIFDFINLSAVSGGVEINKVRSLTSDIATTSGKIVIGNCELGMCTLTKVSGRLDCNGSRFAKINIHSVSGSTHLDNMGCGSIIIKNTSGSINISGRIDGDIEIHSVSGSVSLSLIGNIDDYRKSLSMVSGTARIGDVRLKKGYTELSNKAFVHLMKVTTVSGSINIDFR